MSFVYQDHTVNDRETSQEAKRRKDENGTSKRLFFVFKKIWKSSQPNKDNIKLQLM